MTLLDCNVVNCAYNEDNSCKRSEITVQGTDARKNPETCCGSIEKMGCGCTKDGATNTTSCNCKKNTQVACEAVECVYNKEKECTAGSINIAGGQMAEAVRETCCGSFICS